jgi:23S rRNA pseudouridine2605 synthase
MLARAGLASRREAEDWIRAGRLTVNSVPATLGMKVGPQDQVRLDGRLVRTQPAPDGARVFICHRSPGEPLRPPQGAAEPADARLPRQALLERLPRRAGRRFISISPMPRVDGGLELVTSDGALAERLQRLVHTLDSEFGVRVRGELTEQNLAAILAGELDSGAHLAVERCEGAGGEAANRWYTLVARGASGKQVRQLFERQGALVSRVQRVRLGPLALERTLGRSQFRELTQEELAALLALPAAGEPWASKERPLTP